MSELSSTLSVEWARIDLLAARVYAGRRGHAASAEERQRLETAERAVSLVRRSAPWQKLREAHGLVPLDQDILSCVLAPEAEPQIGWMYQELQPGVGSPFPTPALIDELLSVKSERPLRTRERLASAAPLVRAGLVEVRAPGSFSPVLPTELAQRALLARESASPLRIPGALEIAAGASFEDLVLPAECGRALEEFLCWISGRATVVDAWGARPYGGPIALFAGPSGTGKTLAAEAIAARLGFRLFRVDLGLLVSKYVGETEKNLNALFEAAHGRRVMLLFDEADSLFGKRGEVREARDRYANMEVSHLLSRMERHSGPCILTTNLRQHVDPAFARRFQAVVEFSVPGAEERHRLWKLHVPPRAPRAACLDLELVAREVVLTGGQIRNAATHAACLAAAELMPITLGHVASAILTELGKEGTEVFVSSLGQLVSTLPEERRHA